MARSDRLFRLLQAMRMMPAPITAARLAAEMDISLRSLYRDIDSLRAAGAQIEGERGYGYRLIEDNALPPQRFSRTEIEALSLGLAEVRHMGDRQLETAAASALAKIAASLPDDSERELLHAISQVYRPDTRYTATDSIDTIRQASWHEEPLTIAYSDAGGAASTRTILPLAIVYTDHVLTVLAWCTLRNDFRMFRTDRIAEITKPGGSFRPRRAALLRDYLAKLNAEELSSPRRSQAPQP